jgi:hypothetical protein
MEAGEPTACRVSGDRRVVSRPRHKRHNVTHVCGAAFRRHDLALIKSRLSRPMVAAFSACFSGVGALRVASL